MANPELRVVASLVDRISGPLGSIERKLGGFGSAFRALGGTIAVGAFTRLAADVLESAEQIQNLAERTGIGVEALQEIQGVAANSGISVDAFTKALEFLARINEKAIQGNEQAAASFKRLGLDAQRLAEMPLDRRFEVIATQLAKVKDEGARLALGMAVLGRGSSELFAIIGEGPEKFRELREEIRETGNVLTREQIAALAQADDAWDRLGQKLSASGRLIVADLAPAIETTADKLVDLVDATSRSAAVLGVTFADAVRTATQTIGELWDEISGGDDVNAATQSFGLIGQIVDTLIGKFGDATTEVKQFKAEVADEGFLTWLGNYFDLLTGIAKLDIMRPPEFPQTALPAAGGAVADTAGGAITGAPTPGVTDEDLRRIQIEAKKAFGEISRIVNENRTPWETYQAAVERVNELVRKHGLDAEVAGKEIERLTNIWHDQEAALFRATDAGAEYFKMQDDARQIIEATLTPTEKHLRQLEYLEKLQKAGLFNSDPAAYARAVAAASDEYRKAMEGFAAGNDQMSESMEALFRDLQTAADGFARDLTDVMFDATRDIGDAFENLADVIGRALFTEFVSKPIVEGITDQVGKILKDIQGTQPGPAPDFVPTGADIAEGAADIGETMDKSLGTFTDKFGDKLGSIFGTFTGAIGNTMQKVLGGFANILGNVMSSLFASINQSSTSGSGFFAMLASVFGGGSSSSTSGAYHGGFRAAGGPVFKGSAYIVGERGPELFIPRTGGEIRSHSKLSDVLRSEVLRLVQQSVTDRSDSRSVTTVAARLGHDIGRGISQMTSAGGGRIAMPIIVPTITQPQSAESSTTANYYQHGATPILERAFGGPVFRGVATMVGERGPEVFVPQSVGETAARREIVKAFYTDIAELVTTLVSDTAAASGLAAPSAQELRSRFERVGGTARSELRQVVDRITERQLRSPDIIMPRLRDLTSATERIERAKIEATREIVRSADRYAERILPAIGGADIAEPVLGDAARGRIGAIPAVQPREAGERPGASTLRPTQAEYRERVELLTEQLLYGPQAQAVLDAPTPQFDPLWTELHRLFERLDRPTKAILPAVFGRAKGGPVFPGSPYLVGEEGPELFMPKTSGDVKPINQQAAITFNITTLDPRTAASTIVENRDVIVGIVRQAMHRAGRRPDIA